MQQYSENRRSLILLAFLNIQKGVDNIAVAIVGGQIECKFTRQPFLDDGDEAYFDLSGKNSYHIIMAKASGNSLGPDGKRN